MGKKYIIKSTTINNKTKKVITEEEFFIIEKSFEILNETLIKENIYNIILLNYYDFEKEKNEISLTDEVFRDFNYINANTYRVKLEQRILNLFASFTFYFDSYKKEKNKSIKYIINDFDYIFQLRKSDESFKLIKHIRNHILHNTLLMNSFNISNSIEIRINKKQIKSRFYKSSDYPDLEDIFDLNLKIKDFIQYISEFHKQFRNEFKNRINESRIIIENILNKYEHNYLELFTYDNNSKELNKIPILLDWDNVREDLQKRNRAPIIF